jgi:short-subunit dehydrogenase
VARRQIAASRALVTGASGGLGRAIALELARQGAAVVLLARRADRLDAVVAEITAHGGQAVAVTGDVTQPADRAAALRASADRLGGLDILVNNAGVGALGYFERAAPERLRQIMEVNFFAATELTREALPLLKQGRQPIVVNIGSILAYRGLPRYTEYVASKFALRGLSHALRPELAESGIDLLLVSPAATETDFWDHLIERQTDPAHKPLLSAKSADVARRTVRAIQKGKREVFPDLGSTLLYWADRIAPWAIDWATRGKSPQ